MKPCADCNTPRVVLATVADRRGTRQVGPCCWREEWEARTEAMAFKPAPARTSKPAPTVSTQRSLLDG